MPSPLEAGAATFVTGQAAFDALNANWEGCAG
jgi:hypothetical protein